MYVFKRMLRCMQRNFNFQGHNKNFLAQKNN